MTTSFPGALDSFTNPTASDNLNSVVVPHADQHANENDAIEALEAKVGIDGSLITGSLDYRTRYLENNQHSPVTLGLANGLSLSGQQLSMGLAGSASTGTLSAQDWNTFNGKQSALTFPLAANLGGSGISNTGTFTNHSNTIIVGGGTVSLGGFTLTIGASTTITGGGTLALGGFTLTVPATGTAALLATANVFTTQQMVDGTSDQIQLRVQGHSSQTTNLINFENSTGASVGFVTGVGNITIGTNTNSSTGTLKVGSSSWITPSNGDIQFWQSYAGNAPTHIASFVAQAFSLGSFKFGANSIADLTGSDNGSLCTEVINSSGATLPAILYAKNGTVGTSPDVLWFLNRRSAAVAGEGSSILYRFFNSNSNLRQAGRMTNQWVVATQGSEVAKFSFLPASPNTTGATTLAEVMYISGGAPGVSMVGSAKIASAAGATWNAIELQSATATITGSTNITTATGFNYHSIAQPTLSAASALTVSNAATLYIAHSPLGGGAGPATITNAYALWVDDGIARFDGNVEARGLTAGRVTFAGTNGLLSDDADFTFATDTLTVTKIAATTFTGNVTISTKDIVTDTTTGTKIGTATSQKLSLWNATPDVQPTTAIAAAAFVANTSGIVDDSATFGGYTIGQVVAALKRLGALA